MKADLPIKAIVGAMPSCSCYEATRDVLLTVVCVLLKKDAGGGLLNSAKG